MKKLMSLFLALLMVYTFLPVSVLADNDAEGDPSAEIMTQTAEDLQPEPEEDPTENPGGTPEEKAEENPEDEMAEAGLIAFLGADSRDETLAYHYRVETAAGETVTLAPQPDYTDESALSYVWARFDAEQDAYVELPEETGAVLTLTAAAEEIGVEKLYACTVTASDAAGTAVFTLVGTKTAAENEPETVPEPAAEPADASAGEAEITQQTAVTSGTCGEDVSWKLSEDGTLTISGNGAMSNDWAPGISAPWYTNREKILTVIIENGVTNIGNYAFEACSVLTSIMIPESVTSIGEKAFYNCSSLASLTIPKSVASIGYGIFYNCSSLTNVTVEAENPVYHSDGNCIIKTADKELVAGCKYSVIPADGSVTSIGRSAFNTCSENITLPESIISIGDYAFYKSRLASIVIPANVTNIGSFAFYGCSWLTSITIPDGVTGIGESSFEACSQLTSATIPVGVTTIGDSAFYDCEKLADVYYSGTEADWAKITVGTDNEPLSSATIHYTGVPATVASGKCGDDLTWTFYENGVLSITGTGAMYDFSNSDTAASGRRPWRSYEGEIKTVDIGNGVTSIGNYAFMSCTSLVSVAGLNSVTSIGNYAFQHCNMLTSITGLDSVTSIGNYAFLWCNLASITIPEKVTNIGTGAFSFINPEAVAVAEGNPVYHSVGNCLIHTADKILLIAGKNSEIPTDGSVTSIGDYAFAGYSSLANIEIPECVTRIGKHAFDSCTSLTNVKIPDAVTNIEEYAFANCTSFTNITIPDGVTDIGKCAFEKCSSLLNITIPNSVTSIGVQAFGGCSSLTSFTIPEGLTSIEGHVFTGCSSLSNVKIPDAVTNIGNYAFARCTSFTNITIPDGVTSIGEGTFQECSSLSNITIPNSVTRIGWYAFYNCSALANITIPERVTKIGKHAFDSCTSLTSVTIPGKVTSIEEYAFGSCSNLTSVTISKGVTRIGDYMFYHCSNLKNVVISEGVKGIGAGTFEGCKSLTSIELPKSLEFIGSFAFGGCGFTCIVIPNGEIYGYAFISCQNLTNVILLNGVRSIDNNCFRFCTKLTSITIPSSVTYINSSAFSFCDGGLTDVFYSGEEREWGRISGASDCDALLNATKHYIPTLVAAGKCGNDLAWTLYKSGRFTITGTGAMDDYTSQTNAQWYELKNQISSIEIGDGVTSIGSNAFRDNSRITSITISNSVTSIGENAVAGCSRLTKVNYSSCSTEKWEEITIESGNDPLWNATLHYLDHSWDLGVVTTPAERGKEGVKIYTCTVCKATKTESIPALPLLYTVGYDANGGTGVPEAQIKTENIVLTLSHDQPTRSGYMFLGWATDKAAAIVQYQPGDAYTVNADTTLYAVWKTITITITGANTMLVGGSAQYKATISPKNTLEKVKWSIVSGDGLAEIDADGLLTAGSTPGTVTIRAEAVDGSGVYAEKTVTIQTAEPEYETKLTVSTAKASQGKEVTLDIAIEGNPGVIGISFQINYDKTRLKLTGYTDRAMKDWSVSVGKGEKAVWLDETAGVINGNILTLKFQVLDDAPDGLASVTLTGFKASTLDETAVNATVTAGGVTVTSWIPGDVNDDGEVDIFDCVRLKKYIAGFDVTISEANADVNGDGEIDIFDCVRLKKYLAGFNVELE